ncbi:MAG: hypothetical protein K6U89_19770 [Chloroflexi bacterium]|nr:hypothetical protein [Chloroflexota bacterium]
MTTVFDLVLALHNVVRWGVLIAAVLASLALMQLPPRGGGRRRGVLEDLLGGLAYLRSQPTLQALLLLALLPVVFGMPYMTMLTVFARDVLAVGGSGLGVLTACASVGALLGALYVAVAPAGARGAQMLGALVLFGLALAAFAFTPWVGLAGLLLVVVGVVMLLADRRAPHSRSMEALDPARALFIGVAQALALLPGVSRSGATIAAGMFAGLSRETAARFSFLLAAPVILGAGVVIMEGLTNLGALPLGRRVPFYAPFYKIAGTEGAPARFFAMVE